MRSSLDLTELRDLLAAGNWGKADRQTKAVMTGEKFTPNPTYLNKDVNFQTISCECLQEIDQLWLQHSNGKFGFSVQKKIYKSLGGTKEYNEGILEAFGDRVGWRVEKTFLWWRWRIWQQWYEASYNQKGSLPKMCIAYISKRNSMLDRMTYPDNGSPPPG